MFFGFNLRNSDDFFNLLFFCFDLRDVFSRLFFLSIFSLSDRFFGLNNRLSYRCFRFNDWLDFSFNFNMRHFRRFSGRSDFSILVSGDNRDLRMLNLLDSGDFSLLTICEDDNLIFCAIRFCVVTLVFRHLRHDIDLTFWKFWDDNRVSDIFFFDICISIIDNRDWNENNCIGFISIFLIGMSFFVFFLLRLNFHVRK